MSRSTIEIVARHSRQPVAAWLHDEITPLDLLDAEIAWTPERMKAIAGMLRAGVAETDLPQHRHWNWWEKSYELRVASTRAFGIQCDGQWQGLMMTAARGYFARLGNPPGKPLLYVKYLESAPWNVEIFTPRPKYSAVGMRLLDAAVRVSIADGFEGRIGLHALPNPKTEGFYQRRGFIGFGPDPQMDGLPYYELSELIAQEIRKESE
jgi:hypothetical protein